MPRINFPVKPGHDRRQIEILRRAGNANSELAKLKLRELIAFATGRQGWTVSERNTRREIARHMRGLLNFYRHGTPGESRGAWAQLVEFRDSNHRCWAIVRARKRNHA